MATGNLKTFMRGGGAVPGTGVIPTEGATTGGRFPADIPKIVGSVASPVTNPTATTTTAFAHSTNNISASSTPPQDFQLDFEPNILDNYDQYTYHWKLFITSLEAASTGHVLVPSSQTIIAESGVSDLTIDKVELNGICVPSVEAGTGTQTTVKFEIIEPSGAGLLDKIYYQSVALGVGNWLVMPVFLQLEFRARNPVTGESVADGAPAELAAQKWVWPIKLTGVKANVSNVGTRYEFDAIMYDELAQSNSYFSIQHNVVLQGFTSLGDALRDLENKLNADQFEKLIDNYSIPDTYKIIVDPAIANESLSDVDKNIGTNRGGNYYDLKTKTASFNAGTSIDKIVDTLCGNMNYFQAKMQNTPISTPAAQPNTSTTETNQMKKLWRVITETKPIAYDSLRQDNAVAITVYVVEYDLGMVDVNPSQTGQTPESAAADKKRFLEYAQKKIMKKKYNYIFTGLNDQIKNLDLNMNFAFASALSRFGGIYYDSATSDNGIVAQNNSEAQKNVTEQLRQTLQFINNATSTDDISTKVTETKTAIRAAQLDPTLTSRYYAILNYATSPDKKVYTNKIIAAGGIAADGTTLGQQRTIAKSLAQSVSTTNSNGQDIDLTFVSDVNPNSSQAKAAEATSINLRKGKLRPVPYRENMQEISLTGGIDPASNAARARVSSVFATALYSTIDANMQGIRLTIKGDPFWLFPAPVPVGSGVDVLPYKSNMADADAINSIKNSHIYNPRSVNLYGTDNFIVIRFRTPRIYNQTADKEVDPFTEVNAFSGVYKVITVVSKFEQGVFQQEISCILDPVIDILDFLHAIEADAGKQVDLNQDTPAITPETLTPTTLKKDVNSIISNIPVLTNPTPAQILGQLNSAGGHKT